MTLTVAEAGRLGGLARKEKTTPEQRKKSAIKAAKARWRKHKLSPVK